ncbi:hypothetical protein [Sphingobium sp. BS19]|uniref:hypothetical protein n=1 Tax=Sphingobium sp. BS19 TaxID=3018973 RepID=UPI0022EE4AC4|nr:hypothetical protein [Sphingobium sp. BS19]GLJ00164.1 hypothetical protein Sbs19_39810 [Sphingobium sp. BS19]
MVVPVTSIWTTLNRDLTWGAARALAKSWGGDLTSNLNYNHVGGRTHNFHGAAWVGVTNVNGEFVFLDGSNVRDKYAEGVYYENDFRLGIPEGVAEWPAPHPILIESYLSESFDGVSSQLVWDVAGTSIKGTAYWDVIQPAYLSGITVDLGDGDDEIFIQGPSVETSYIKMGAGNDIVTDWGGGYMEIRDGDGSDMIETFNGKIIASLDGDNDSFYTDKLVYEGAKADITVNGGSISSSEIGDDQATISNELTLGSGNDVVNFSSASKVYSKAGNDVVNIAGEYELARTADGGDGNDMLLARYGNVRLIGGNGDDRLSLYDWDGISKVEMTGGSGSDRFEFDTLETIGSLRPIINDFSAKGTVQDSLDLTAFDLVATSVADALSKGLLSMTTSKGYTYLTVEGGDASADLTLMLKGSFGSDIHDNIWI